MTQSQLKQIARDVAEEVYLPQLSQDAYELLVYRITQAITAAILSERQSIAQLLTQEADKIEESSGPKAYRIPSSEVARLRNLATLILSLPNPPSP